MKKLYTILYVFFLIVLIPLVSAFDSSDPRIKNWYNLDAASGDINDSIDQPAGYNMSMTVLGTPVFQESGLAPNSDYSIKVSPGNIFKSGFKAQGNMTFENVRTNRSWCIVMWTNFTSTDDKTIIDTDVTGAAAEYIYYHGNFGTKKAVLRLQDADIGGTELDEEFSYGLLSVTMHGFCWNKTHIYGHYNGTKDTGYAFNIRFDQSTAGNFYLGGSAQGVTGQIDDVVVFEKTDETPGDVLSPAEWSDLYINWLTDVVAGATSTPTIVDPSPVDNSHNNTNVTLNVTHSTLLNDVRYYLYFGDTSTLDETDFYLFNATRTADEHKNFTTNVSDGIYYWKWKVQNITDGVFSANTTQRTLIIDTATPTITLGSNNFFAIDNTTRITSYLLNGTLNISFYDTYLEGGQTLINITNSTGDSVFSIHNTTITGTTVNISEILDISSFGLGNYTIELSAVDSHTLNIIENYDVKNGIKTLTFDTAEGNHIEISSDGSSYSTLYNKKKNSYEFGWNYILTDSTRKFTIKADNKIQYLPNSKYIGHFVVGNVKGGNWIDFEGFGSDKYTVKKINDYEYEITFIELPLTNQLITKSLGGLNTIREDYQFEITSVVNVQAFNKITNASLTFSATLLGQTKNASAGENVTFYNVSVGSYSIVVESEDFDTDSTTRSITNSYHNFSVYLTSGNLFDNCTIWNIKTINFTLLNITSNSRIEGVMAFIFTYNSSNQTLNYSTSQTTSNTSFCIKDGFTIVSDVLIDYSVAETTYEYSLTDFTLNGTTQNINLYSQDGTTRVTFTVTDLFDDPLDGAYIKILKYDVATHTYSTTEIIKTNNDGEAIGNIILYTEWYKFIIEYNSISYIVTEPSKMFSTTKVFRIDLTAADWFANFDTTLGVATELNFTNSTLNFRYTWNDATGAMHQGCLQVVKMNRTVEKTICDSCTTSTAATILCYIGPSSNVQGSRFIAQGYLKYDLIYITDILEKIFGGGKFEPLWEKGAEEREFGVFLSFMLILSLVMIGVWSPVTAIVMTLVGFFIVSTLGFLKLQTSALITLVILGIIVIYRISKR